MAQDRQATPGPALTGEVVVRPMEARDLAAVVGLVRMMAEFHGSGFRLTEAILERDALGDGPWLRVVVAEYRKELIGYMALCPQVKLQFGARGMNLHHMYILRDFRERGVLEMLFAASAEIAVNLGCQYLTGGTHPANRRSQAALVKLGFRRAGNRGVYFERRIGPKEPG